jgi:2-C-methyl-D-erythritol 4-phosphate cytidylyltransferase
MSLQNPPPRFTGKTAAIIPAGGAGARMGGKTAKPYLTLDSLPIIVHTLRVFEASPLIDAVILVVRDEDKTYVRDDIVMPFAFTKVTNVISGGKTRQDSVNNALPFLADDHDLVVVHDGVRPLAEHLLLERVIEAAQNTGAAAVGVPVKDTCKIIDTDFFVLQTIDRGSLYQIQTPQAFKKEILLDAHGKAIQDGFHGTDDASLAERMGISVKVIAGSYENIKITTPDDLLQAELIVKKRKKRRIAP